MAYHMYADSQSQVPEAKQCHAQHAWSLVLNDVVLLFDCLQRIDAEHFLMASAHPVFARWIWESGKGPPLPHQPSPNQILRRKTTHDLLHKKPCANPGDGVRLALRGLPMFNELLPC